jgi:cytochrome-b5 reductase
VPELPPRPEPPDPRDCCGSGCVRCIFEIYDEALSEWERTVARLQQEEAARSEPAAPPE